MRPSATHGMQDSGPSPNELRALRNRRSASRDRAHAYLLAMCHRAMERVARGGGTRCVYVIPPFVLGQGRYDPVEVGKDLKRRLRAAGYRASFDPETLEVTVAW